MRSGKTEGLGYGYHGAFYAVYTLPVPFVCARGMYGEPKPTMYY